MKKNSIILLIFLTLLYSCNNDEFKTHKSGLKYKFIVENEQNPTAKIGDVQTLIFSAYTPEYQELETSGIFRIQLTKPLYEGGTIEDALSMMHKGDSALFLLNAIDYYTQTRKIPIPKELKRTKNVCLAIKVLDIITKEEYEQEQKDAQIIAERYEDRQMSAYLKKHNISEEPTLSGLYIVKTHKTNAEFPTPGKKVTIHYNGYFVDGKLFDSSVKRNEPFTFTLGVGNVIDGLEEGVSKMRKGEKAQLIIPSSLAYGNKQQGPIPPNSILIFDIELMDIE